MVLLSNSAAQTLAVGQSVVFDTTVTRRGCNECHRNNSSSVKMRTAGMYEVTYSANVASPTADTTVQLVLEVGGEVLPETVMMSTPATATTEFNNVSTTTIVSNCCMDYSRITVTNNGTAPIIVNANSALFIKRIEC